jgi:antitoxin MazE
MVGGIFMKAKIQKWGKSLAVRIPESLAADAGLEEDAAVDLKLVRGKVVVDPLTSDQVTLNELLTGVTSKNLHDAWDTGMPVGREVW